LARHVCKRQNRHGDQYWNDVSQNFKPLYEEFKKQGWVVDYKFYTNPVTEHPDDGMWP